MYQGVNVYLGVIVSQRPAVGLLLYRFEYSLVRVFVCLYVCVCTCMYAYVCIYMYVSVCICVCMYVYICIYLFIFL